MEKLLKLEKNVVFQNKTVKQIKFPFSEFSNNDTKQLDQLFFEKRYYKLGFVNIAGIDEAGRGPLCGPVVASAVILPQNTELTGIDDSKKLSAKARQKALILIKKNAVAYGIGVASVAEIDKFNILEATRLAMKRAVQRLKRKPDLLLIDAVELSDIDIPYHSIIKGDARSISIAAASIIAKETRDRIMEAIHRKYPHFLLNQNKGYGTIAHRKAIAKFGPCIWHRKTFRGVKEFII